MESFIDWMSYKSATNLKKVLLTCRVLGIFNYYLIVVSKSRLSLRNKVNAILK